MHKQSGNPDIILIHGFRGAPSGLQPIADVLETAGYRVHTPAIPPFAGAQPLPTYSPAAYADFINGYITTNKLLSPILIGHSMGSIVAAATASYHPEVIHQKLILLSPISKKPSPAIAAISPLSAYFPRRVVDTTTTAFLFVKDRETLNRVDNRALLRDTLAATKICSSDHSPKKKSTVAAARFSSMHAIADFDFNKDTLLIAGAHDRLISQKATISLAQKINAKVRFIPNSGHLHNYEKPAETAKLILDFLEDA